MNYSMIVYIIGWILAVEAALMVPSGVVAIIYGETVGWVFAATITLCLALGLPLIRRMHAAYHNRPVSHVLDLLLKVTVGGIDRRVAQGKKSDGFSLI